VTRIGLTLLSRCFHWRDALVVVRPETLIRWHRAGWKLFWRLKSRPGRPPIPPQLRALIRPWIVALHPELRIVSEDLWEKVKARQRERAAQIGVNGGFRACSNKLCLPRGRVLQQRLRRARAAALKV
jgi:hypothetical protein